MRASPPSRLERGPCFFGRGWCGAVGNRAVWVGGQDGGLDRVPWTEAFLKAAVAAGEDHVVKKLLVRPESI